MAIKYIRSLRAEACDVLQDKFVLQDQTPIWTKVKEITKLDQNTYFRKQIRLRNEKNICKSNCTPISIAALKKLKHDHPNLQARVVVGKMTGIESKIDVDTLNNCKSRFLSWSTYQDFGNESFHSWIEVSNNNFTKISVIDLTLSFANEDHGNFDNYSSVYAKRNKLVHTSILTEEKDVKSFFFNLLKTQLRDQNEFNECFKIAIDYLN